MEACSRGSHGEPRCGGLLRSSRIALASLRSGELPILFCWIKDREQVLFNALYKPVSEANNTNGKHVNVVISTLQEEYAGA